MVSTIEALRNHGLIAAFGISSIKLYQNTLSKIAPSRCRYTPSCSQYGIEAIEEWGLIEGIKLTRKRISRCHRPNSGYDPVPRKNHNLAAISHKNSDAKTTQKELNQANFETIPGRISVGAMIDYDHSFRLILSYPCNREFLSMEDFRAKITEFNHFVFEVPNYSLLYRVSQVEVGVINDYYLLRFSGTISEEYLENSVDQIIDYITAQLAGFLLAAQASEFTALYFQVDGQVFITPQPEAKAVPKGYQGEQNFWDFTSNPDIWDIYWGDFVIDLLSGISEVTRDSLELSIDSIANDTSSFDTNSNLNDATFDGCDVNINPFDGCDSGGCDLGGCDGCDSGGCDLGGCDGCGGGGCDLGGCDGCS